MKICKRLILILIVALAANVSAEAQSSAKKLRERKQTTQREIRETNKKISQNTAQTKKRLNQLNQLNVQISKQSSAITQYSAELDEVNAQLKKINDSIKTNTRRINMLKQNYAKAVKSIQQRNSDTSILRFIFSSESFSQAVRRMRYLQEFSRWRQRETAAIENVQKQLEAQRARAELLQREKQVALTNLSNERKNLEISKNDKIRVLDILKKEGASLKKVLAEKERQYKKLDRELNNLIEKERKAAEKAEKARREAEARKAREAEAKSKSENAKTTATEKPSSDSKVAETSKPSTTPKSDSKLSGSFESNRGNLIKPVSKSYRIIRPFGRQKHPELKYVETDNGGIDILTDPGAQARAVFDGVVSVVFKTDGFNNVVMVRHGNYLTIYANLDSVSVKAGDKVKAGQSMGRIFSDPENGNQTVLHFEIRKERQKLNPQEWIH